MKLESLGDLVTKQYSRLIQRYHVDVHYSFPGKHLSGYGCQSRDYHMTFICSLQRYSNVLLSTSLPILPAIAAKELIAIACSQPDHHIQGRVRGKPP